MHKILSTRRAGVLLHISSLPSGDLGEDAYKFVDFLAESGVTVWQTLPLNMPHADGSPYQCLSAHAGNTNFISLSKLYKNGYLNANVILEKRNRPELIAEAYLAFSKKKRTKAFRAYEDFCTEQKFWLDDFALFLAIRDKFNFAGWNSWPDEYKYRDKSTIAEFAEILKNQIDHIKFSQYLFFSQWAELKSYANSKGIYLFGDVPIFVAYDSSDVWAQPNQFKLDDEGEMTVVAGVPPDYFSETGQRWGNPHYNWDVMAVDQYAWWLDRMNTLNSMFDLVRIDHFRGLESAWEIEASEPTAIKGHWTFAPGEALLSAIKSKFPDICLIAEDLGIITPEVNALRENFDLPGMKILQFAFGGDANNPYLPENVEENSVMYTGTHDNDTTLGWYQHLDEGQKEFLHQYLNTTSPNMPFALTEVAFASKSCLAIIPMQDILELGSDDRMNIPGTTEGNWQWHFSWMQLKAEQRKKLALLVKKYSRH